jgi:hypothetical protein
MNAPDTFLTLNLGEAEVRVPREAAVVAYLERLVDQRRAIDFTTTLGARAAFQQDCAPAIGAAYQGGICAGLSLHEGKPVELILLPGEREEITWAAAVKWAEEQGGTLPSRIDQLVLLANLKAEFKEAYYWSGAQTADDERWAWCQSFGYGNQSTNTKGGKLRARAVRRAAI